VSGPTVELLCDAKAVVGERPFCEPETKQLLWADITEHSINFLDLKKGTERVRMCCECSECGEW